MITKYPLGLMARTDYFRVLKSIWTQEVKDFLIKRMVDAPSNVKPVIVLDDVTKKSKCYFINENNTDFELITSMEGVRHCRRVDSIANYMIGKVKFQKSNKSEKQKEELVKLLEKKYIKKEKLTFLEEKKIK
tara:strand:+ start:517 stop:912 length:396 start_codon:yes stop_codon:yes gene_type:complete